MEKGVKKLIVNGKEIPGNLITMDQLKEKNEVMVVMG